MVDFSIKWYYNILNYLVDLLQEEWHVYLKTENYRKVPYLSFSFRLDGNHNTVHTFIIDTLPYKGYNTVQYGIQYCRLKILSLYESYGDTPIHSGQTAVYGSYRNHTLIYYMITDNLSCFNTNRYSYFLKTHQYHLVYGSYDGLIRLAQSPPL